MTCSDAQAMMIDARYGELSAADDARLTAHIDLCPGCQQRRGELRSVLDTMSRWLAPAPTGKSASRALARVSSARAPAMQPFQVSFRVRPLAERDRDVTTGSGRSLADASPRWAQSVALAAPGAVLAVAVGLGLPVSSIVEMSDRWIHTSLGFPCFALALLVFAVLSSAGPLLVGSLLLFRQTRRVDLRGRAVHYAVYAGLVMPLVYVQCLTLPPPARAIWIVGAILGVVAGPLSIRWARRQLSSRD